MMTIQWWFDMVAVLDSYKSRSLLDDNGPPHTASRRPLSPLGFVHYMHVHVYITCTQLW
jgi:hypothetical protein